MLLILSVTFVLLFVAIIGIFVQKHVRRSRRRDSAWRGRGNRQDEIVTPIVLETFDKDSGALYGGK